MNDHDPTSTLEFPATPLGQAALRFSRHFLVGWGAVDANGHMRNTAYFDAAADVRLAFLESRGWDRGRLEATGLGPVAFEERVTYRRELRLRDGFIVTLELAGVSADGARLRLRSRFLDREERELAALTSDLGWMDLATRRLAPAPRELADSLLQLTCTDDFTALHSWSAAADAAHPRLHLVPPSTRDAAVRTSRA
jgi:acyl-CoA thioester hydrolase